MYIITKRCIDFIIALIIIAALLPLFILISIILLLTGEHYVFYFQERMGKNGKLFKIWKFATMLKDSPKIGTGTITLRNDPRVLPFGHFLRKTKINEFPQLINILIGDMSFVGPRPVLSKEFQTYTKEVQLIIAKMNPGLTGIGSIVFRDEEFYTSQTKDPATFHKTCIRPIKGELEMWYYHHRSLYTDFMIAFLTGWVILFPKNQLVHSIFKDLPPFDLDKEVENFNQRQQ